MYACVLIKDKTGWHIFYCKKKINAITKKCQITLALPTRQFPGKIKLPSQRQTLLIERKVYQIFKFLFPTSTVGSELYKNGLLQKCYKLASQIINTSFFFLNNVKCLSLLGCVVQKCIIFINLKQLNSNKLSFNMNKILIILTNSNLTIYTKVAAAYTIFEIQWCL